MSLCSKILHTCAQLEDIFEKTFPKKFGVTSRNCTKHKSYYAFCATLGKTFPSTFECYDLSHAMTPVSKIWQIDSRINQKQYLTIESVENAKKKKVLEAIFLKGCLLGVLEFGK